MKTHTNHQAAARNLIVHAEGRGPAWIVSHPALPRPLRIDPADPGRLSPNDAFNFSQAWLCIGFTLWTDLVGALMHQRGLDERHAEDVVDAWEMHSLGETPGSEAAPVLPA